MLAAYSITFAQPIFLTGASALDQSEAQLKGHVSQISERHSSRLGWVDFNFHTIKIYNNNRLVEREQDGDFGHSKITYSYENDGRLKQRKTEEFDQDSGALLRAKSESYHYGPQEITIIYDKKDRRLNLSKEVLAYDKHQRLVAYQKYNLQDRLLLDVAHTYAFDTNEKRLLNTLKVTYARGQVDETRTLTYHSAPFSINGIDCEKVRIEKSIQPKDAAQPRKEICYEYVKPDGTVLRQTSYLAGIPRLYEWVYAYDDRGNWISKAEYQKNDGALMSYYQRKITYSDGHTTGSDTYDQKTIWDKKFIPGAEQFYFKKIIDKNQVQVLNRFQKNISSKIRFLGNLKSTSAFIHYPKEKALVELVDYDIIEDGDLHEARLLTDQLGDALLKSSAGHFYVFDNNVLLSAYNQESIDDNLGIIFNPETGHTFQYQWSKSPVHEMIPLQKLPTSEQHTYWLLVKSNSGTEQLLVFKKGKLIDHSQVKLEKASNQDVVLYNGPEIMLLKNAQTTELNQIYPTQYLSPAEAKTLVAANKPTAPTPSAAQPTADQSNFGCYEDVACLNRRAIQTFNKTKQSGQSEEVAYQQMAQIFDQVYQNKKQLTFEMMMTIDGQYSMGLLKTLSPEVRQYIRERSRQRVNEYTEKHGKPKIKTVPYNGN